MAEQPRKPRVMWLLNHTTARKFEVKMLNAIGYHEIFLPKIFPQDVTFRSASVDFSQDANLTIPAEDLAIMNAADWYGNPGKDAWEVANKHFDILFFIIHKPEIVSSIGRNWKGIAIWRAYGFDKSLSYSWILRLFGRLGTLDVAALEHMGERFIFGEAFAHLHEIEGSLVRDHALFLPVGMPSCSDSNDWEGNNARIFFVCPDIGFNAYYKKVYQQFLADFDGMPYAIGGAQPVAVKDPNVLGFVTREEHERNMKQMRVMFYHSREPNHIHYHPFEAINAGMPLIFMSGGVLDRRGGMGQPGRCTTVAQARCKIHRILKGDQKFIARIRKEQVRMLDPMRPESCVEDWRIGFNHIEYLLQRAKQVQSLLPAAKPKRIAVLLPEVCRGNKLLLAKKVAQAILRGSIAYGEDVEVVLGHHDTPEFYCSEDFVDLPPEIARRPFRMKILARKEARQIAKNLNNRTDLNQAHYMVPDDGINQFLDCDLWIFIGDRIPLPILKLRPYACMVDHYRQRYERDYENNDIPFLETARRADGIMVTSAFTKQDAQNYAGVLPSRVHLVPMLVSPVGQQSAPSAPPEMPYFVWKCSFANHENHLRAMQALREYYEVLGGTLACRIVGVAGDIVKGSEPCFPRVSALYDASPALQQNLTWLGEVPAELYRAELANAAFLWRPVRVDLDALPVLEAALSGVPSLVEDCPLLREVDVQWTLNLQWMDTDNPGMMAKQIMYMQQQAQALRTALAAPRLTLPTFDQQGLPYWKVIREWL